MQAPAALLRAVVVDADDAGLAVAAEKLRSGGNVAFPTETVYGLGGNALDENAVNNIFVKKGRPLSDPLIVHVLTPEAALELVQARGVTRRIFEALAAKFWPGPLTMVLAANERVPSTVCAGTGFVGVRCPAHPVAQDLLRLSGVPVAAPSANRFGHVSPTCAQHVVDDLGDQDIVVVDGGSVADGTCSVGIESTVLKVTDSDLSCDDESSPRSLVLFRKGGVSEAAIRAALDGAGLGDVKIVSPAKPVVEHRPSAAAGAPALQEADGASDEAEAEAGLQAPGQLLTHYAPDLDTWLIRADAEGLAAAPADPRAITVAPGQSLSLGACAVIDYNGTLVALRPLVRAYRDISPEGSAEGAAQNIFDALRWTESTGASHVLIQDVSHAEHELAPSVADRMFRAASGKVADSVCLTSGVPEAAAAP